MNNKSRKLKHEEFHSCTMEQNKLISKNNFTYRNILQVINKYVSEGQDILDIGCGSGTISFYLASKGNIVEGIDISDKAIHECKKSAKNLNLSQVTDFRVMDFPNNVPSGEGRFDAVILIEVLEHLPNDRLALKKLYKLLKKNGIIIVSTPSLRAPMYRMGLANSFDKRVGHLRRYSLESLRNLCENEGFIVLEEYGTEGVIRNFLFLNPIAGKFVRFVKYFVSNIVTFFDNISCKMFGESDLFIVLKK